MLVTKSRTPFKSGKPKFEIADKSDSNSDRSSDSEPADGMDLDEENHLSDDDDFKMSDSSAEEEESDDDEDNSSNESATEEGNVGWADSMAKVLKSHIPKSKKFPILAKVKKISELEKVKREKKYNFEIEGEIKDEKPDDEEIDQEAIKFIQLEKRKVKDHILRLRVKPSILERERDKAFKKIATKGVVQLFNAVRTQQKDITKQLEEAGPIDHKRDRVINSLNKRKFLDVLMKGSRAKSELIDNPVKKEEIKGEDDEETENKSKKTTWSVLRDDFLTGKKMKHWDKDDKVINNDSDNTDSD